MTALATETTSPWQTAAAAAAASGCGNDSLSAVLTRHDDAVTCDLGSAEGRLFDLPRQVLLQLDSHHDTQRAGRHTPILSRTIFFFFFTRDNCSDPR